MIRRLTKLAKDMSLMGLQKEADYLGTIIRLAAEEKGITFDFGEDEVDADDYVTWNQAREEFDRTGKIPTDDDPSMVARLEARISTLEKEVKRLKGESYSEWYDEQDAATQHEHDRDMHQQDTMDISREFHEHEMDVD